MFTLLRRIPKSRLAFLGFFEQSADIVKTPGYEDLSPKYTGLAALHRMFTPNEYGELSQELATAVHMSGVSCCLGIIYGAVIHGREAWFTFMENNQATQFANHMDAKKKLQDRVTTAMGRGALKWGFRIGGFTSIFIFLNACIRVYRGEPGILEYVGAGAITGGLFKMNLGPKGMVAGTLVGSFLGLVGGAASMILLFMTGYTIDDIEKTQHEMHKSRNEAIRIAMKTQMLEDEYEVAKIKNATKEARLNPKSPLDTVPDTESKESVE